MMNKKILLICELLVLLWIPLVESVFIEQDVSSKLDTQEWVRVTIMLENMSSDELLSQLGNNFILENKDYFRDKWIGGRINRAGLQIIQNEDQVKAVTLPQVARSATIEPWQRNDNESVVNEQEKSKNLPFVEQEVTDKLTTQEWVEVSITLQDNISSSEIVKRLGNNFVLESKDYFRDKWIDGKINSVGLQLIQNDGRIKGIVISRVYSTNNLKRGGGSTVEVLVLISIVSFVFYLIWRLLINPRRERLHLLLTVLLVVIIPLTQARFIEPEVSNKLNTQEWVRVSIKIKNASSDTISNVLSNNFILKSKDYFHDEWIDGEINRAGFELVRNDARIESIVVARSATFNTAPITSENINRTKTFMFVLVIFIFVILLYTLLKLFKSKRKRLHLLLTVLLVVIIPLTQARFIEPEVSNKLNTQEWVRVSIKIKNASSDTISNVLSNNFILKSKDYFHDEWIDGEMNYAIGAELRRITKKEVK